MRIEFPHSDRDDFLWAEGTLRIGSDADNDLCLAEDSAAGHHAVIKHDPAIGLVLEVLPGVERVYVNARPVRERALLRYGDILSLGRSRLLLCVDQAGGDAKVHAGADASTAGVIGIRAVAGPLSGKVWSLTEQLLLGASGSPLPMPAGEVGELRFERWRQGLRLSSAQASSRFPVRINGVVLSLPQALAPGDQVGLGMHRFVIEAPGLLIDRIEPAPAPAPRLPPPEEAAGPKGEVWWLILTAAILALGISLVLWIHR